MATYWEMGIFMGIFILKLLVVGKLCLFTVMLNDDLMHHEGFKLYNLFFSNLKLCLATANHNCRLVKYVYLYSLNENEYVNLTILMPFLVCGLTLKTLILTTVDIMCFLLAHV